MNQKAEREEIRSYILFYPSLDCVLNSQHKSPALKFILKFRAFWAAVHVLWDLSTRWPCRSLCFQPTSLQLCIANPGFHNASHSKCKVSCSNAVPPNTLQVSFRRRGCVGFSSVLPYGSFHGFFYNLKMPL